MAEFTLKVGDTLKAECIYKDAGGLPFNITAEGIEIASAVVSSDGLSRFPLNVTIKNQAVTLGGYTVEGSSADWPPGKDLLWDIRYTQDGESLSTRTIKFNLNPSVT